MKALFVGLGSIGVRHLNNLKKLVPDTSIHVYKPNPLHGDLKSMADKCESDINKLDDSYDWVFICNPTAYHLESIEKFNQFSDCFFVEKPVHYDGHVDLGKYKIDLSKRYYVAAPLRHSPVLKLFKEQYKGDAFSVRAVCSSYLPHWRKGKDYRDSYSVSYKDGGGVSVDLIHELDYLTDIFGMPLSVKSCLAKVSNLELDVDDLAVYILEYQDKIIELHLDYFGIKNQRYFEVMTPDNYFKVDFLANVIENPSGIMSASADDMYLSEMTDFIAFSKNELVYNNNLSRGLELLKIARRKDEHTIDDMR